jgi:hypothetical protein
LKVLAWALSCENALHLPFFGDTPTRDAAILQAE